MISILSTASRQVCIDRGIDGTTQPFGYGGVARRAPILCLSPGLG